MTMRETYQPILMALQAATHRAEMVAITGDELAVRTYTDLVTMIGCIKGEILEDEAK